MTFTNNLFDIESIQNPLEAAAAIYFLEGEIYRHKLALRQAESLCGWHSPSQDDYNQALAALQQSAVNRHQEDITASEAKRDKVKATWRME